MKRANKKIEWYAMNYDWNEHRVKFFNVIREEILEKIKKGVKKGDWRLDNSKIESLKDLKKIIESELKYYYWSRSEYEIAVNDLFPRDLESWEKISVYDQLEPNLDRITEYINKELGLELK